VKQGLLWHPWAPTVPPSRRRGFLQGTPAPVSISRTPDVQYSNVQVHVPCMTVRISGANQSANHPSGSGRAGRRGGASRSDRHRSLMSGCRWVFCWGRIRGCPKSGTASHVGLGAKSRIRYRSCCEPRFSASTSLSARFASCRDTRASSTRSRHNARPEKERRHPLEAGRLA
jgi:hypothetical protein